jgi:D-alanyl-D-alanine carboxypeptidase
MGYTHTWMPTLEPMPPSTLPLVHQYWDAKNWDSYDIDVSVDLYGGGGIACTASDIARFNRDLLTGKVVKDPAVLQRIYTEVQTQDSLPSDYLLGLVRMPVGHLMAFGHGGFWRTEALYLPALDAAISIVVLEREHRELKEQAVRGMVGILAK